MGVFDFATLAAHTGHKIECVQYGGENVALECVDCSVVLVDYTAPSYDQLVAERQASRSAPTQVAPVAQGILAVDQQELVTLLNCAEAELIGYVDEDTGADDEFGETPAAKTVRELHEYLLKVEPDHACSITKSDAEAEDGPYECAECGMSDHPTGECPNQKEKA